MSIAQPVSAAAEKSKLLTIRARRLACGAVLIGAAVLPALPAYGTDAPAPRSIAQRSTAVLPLPALPYLETTPWLDWGPYRGGLKVDTLQLPASPPDGVLDDGLCRQRHLALPIS